MLHGPYQLSTANQIAGYYRQLRIDVPALIAEVRRLRGQVTALQAQVKEARVRLQNARSEIKHAYDVGLPGLPPRDVDLGLYEEMGLE